MDERLRFVARLLEGEMTARCAPSSGSRRKTGYKIYDRYKDCGVQGLTDRSRRPQRQAGRHHHWRAGNLVRHYRSPQQHPDWCRHRHPRG